MGDHLARLGEHFIISSEYTRKLRLCDGILLSNGVVVVVVVVFRQLPTKTLQVNNHIDPFMQFLVMSRINQVATTSGC